MVWCLTPTGFLLSPSMCLRDLSAFPVPFGFLLMELHPYMQCLISALLQMFFWGLLREMGVQLIAYIDNIFILAHTRELARSHAEGLLYLLQKKKSVLELAQDMEFLALTMDTVKMELSLPVEKIKKRFVWSDWSHEQ